MEKITQLGTEEYKTCTKCKKDKSVSAFHKTKRTPSGLHGWCKDCMREYGQVHGKEYRKKHKEHKLAYNRLHRKNNPAYYKRTAWMERGIDLTLDEYNRKFFGQKGYCAICGKHQSEFGRTFDVDHNHETNQVRGLVCNLCNLVIGHVEKRKNLMGKVNTYLAIWNSKSIPA